MWLFSLIGMAISTIALDDNQLFDVVAVVRLPRYHDGREDGFRKKSDFNFSTNLRLLWGMKSWPFFCQLLLLANSKFHVYRSLRTILTKTSWLQFFLWLNAGIKAWIYLRTSQDCKFEPLEQTNLTDLPNHHLWISVAQDLFGRAF